jgi:AraC-like DNA-binding protein
MRRTRRVRYVYPQPMMDLTIALSLRHGKRAVTELLFLPSSTLYRWLDLFRRDPMRFSGVGHAQSDEGLRHLIGACQAHGFNIRGDLEIVLGPIKSARRLLADDDAPAGNRVAISNPNRFANPLQTGLLQQQDFDHVFANNERGNRVSLPAQTRIEFARARIDMSYYSKLSCEALARMTNMSKWHFIRTFSAAYGTSPYHYLTRVRVLKAKHLLHTTSHSLEAIATAVGFDTQSSLSRAFKSVEGMSLSSFFRGTRIGSLPPTAPSSSGGDRRTMKTNCAPVQLLSTPTTAMTLEETA